MLRQAASRGVVLVRNLETGKLVPLEELSPVRGRKQAAYTHNTSPRSKKPSGNDEIEKEAAAFEAAKKVIPPTSMSCARLVHAVTIHGETSPSTLSTEKCFSV